MRVDMVSEHASPLAALGGADAGGQNVHVAELANGLAKLGHQVVVYTRKDSANLPASIHPAPGVTVEHVPAGPARPIPKDDLLPHMAEFGDYLAARWSRDPPDVVHAHFWMSGVAAHRGARGLALPMVQTFHALGRVKRRHQLGDTSPPERVRVEAELARAADLVIATCSDEVRELAEMGVRTDHVAVVPCGIDLMKFVPEGPTAPRTHRPRILSIGRLVERKGVDDVIAALTAVPRAELVIAGGPAAPEWDADTEVHRLKVLAERLELADRVTFLGPLAHDRVPTLYRSADVVVGASWYEPFGTVPLEAMACEVPPVVTSVGGHLDTVLEAETGLFTPPRDSAALATRLRGLIDDPQWRRQLGKAGLAHVRSRFGWQNLAGHTEAAYGRVHVRKPVAASMGGKS